MRTPLFFIVLLFSLICASSALAAGASNAAGADWVVSYPFAAGDGYAEGFRTSIPNGGAMTACMPSNGACSVHPNKPRIAVAQQAALTDSSEAFYLTAPAGSKIVDVYLTVEWRLANNARLGLAVEGTAGVNQAQDLRGGSNTATSATFHMDGSFDSAIVYLYRKGTATTAVGAGNVNYLAITNVDVRFREQSAPTVTENTKINGSSFLKGVVCSNTSGSASGSGMGSLGLVVPDVAVVTEIGAPGTGSRYTPGHPGQGPVDLCFDTSTYADGNLSVAAFGRSAIGQTKTNAAYTIKIDNRAPVVTEVVKPVDLLRPKFSVKASDGAGSGVNAFSVTLDGAPVNASDTNLGTTVSNSASGYSFAWSTSTSKAQIAPGLHTVVYTVTDKMGFAASGSFTFTTPPLPANTTAPTIDGIAQVGRTVTCNPGVWANAEATYTYVWNSNGAATSNKTQTQTFKDFDLNKAYVCVVTAKGPGGTATAQSAPVQVTKFVDAKPPTTTPPGTTPPTTGTPASCAGKIARSVTRKTIATKAGRKVISIAKKRQGKCVTLVLKVKKGTRFVPIAQKRVALKTGKSAAAKATNRAGSISVRFARTTGTTLKITVIGGSATIRY